jgi:hypothetical protein
MANYALRQDGHITRAFGNDQQQDYYNFSFNIPSGATINGIEAKFIMTRSATPGSCPFLYLSDGSNYNYYTDLAGEMLGTPWFKPEKYESGIYELGDFQPIDGTYKMKIREIIPESDFYDEAKLVLVDVPNGYSVLNT